MLLTILRFLVRFEFKYVMPGDFHFLCQRGLVTLDAKLYSTEKQGGCLSSLDVPPGFSSVRQCVTNILPHCCICTHPYKIEPNQTCTRTHISDRGFLSGISLSCVFLPRPSVHRRGEGCESLFFISFLLSSILYGGVEVSEFLRVSSSV